MLVVQAPSHTNLLELQMDAVGGLKVVTHTSELPSLREVIGTEDCGWIPSQSLVKVCLCSVGDEHGREEGCSK